MFTQIAADDGVLSPIQPRSGPVRYAIEERARIAQLFFDPPLSTKDGMTLDRHIAIVDDFVSLYTRRKRRPQKSRQA